MKNKILVFFVMIFVSYQSFGQGFYPFRYHILTDTVPDRYVITYTRMDTTEDAMPDSIRIDIIDSVYNPSFGFLTIIYPDTIYRIDFYSDNSQIRYNPVLKLHYSAWRVYCDETVNKLAHPIVDTGITHHITQITIVVGRDYCAGYTVCCKYPLSKRKKNEIRAYLTNGERGLEPVCVRKKHCRISLPDI